jgi:hypothetical protein
VRQLAARPFREQPVSSGEEDTDTMVDSMSEAILMSNWAVVSSEIWHSIQFYAHFVSVFAANDIATINFCIFGKVESFKSHDRIYY